MWSARGPEGETKAEVEAIFYPEGNAQNPDSQGHLVPLPTQGWPHLAELLRITSQQTVLPNLDIPPLEKPSAGVCSPGAHLARHTLERNGLSSRDWRKTGLGERDGASPNPWLCTRSVGLPSSPGTRWASGNKRCPQRVRPPARSAASNTCLGTRIESGDPGAFQGGGPRAGELPEVNKGWAEEGAQPNARGGR